MRVFFDVQKSDILSVGDTNPEGGGCILCCVRIVLDFERCDKNKHGKFAGKSMDFRAFLLRVYCGIQQTRFTNCTMHILLHLTIRT